MSLPPLDLSTILFLFYLIAFLLGSRGLANSLRDGSLPMYHDVSYMEQVPNAENQ
jgi:hypothetical protein